MGQKDALAAARAMAASDGTAPGLVRYASDEEVTTGTATNRAISVARLRKYIDARVQALEDAEVDHEVHPSFVIGPTNTLQVPGIWLETTPSGVPLMLHYDDHDGAAGSNADGLFYAGPTNGLTGPGLWLQTDGSGHPMNLFYDDGAH